MRVLCIGAHQDDCEGSVGGTAILFRRRGDDVCFVSVTDGSRGHYFPEYGAKPELLIERRAKESIAATEPFGIEYQNMGIPDGEVYVAPENTEAMIRLIRRYRPDLILTNRPCDYHRDHRYTAQLVLDASYMLTVPLLCPETPALQHMPIIAYWQDRFTEATPFRTDVTVDISAVLEQKMDMMMAHESQYLEWLPFNASPGTALWNLPEEVDKRRTSAREALLKRSGSAEAFQWSEYGSQPTEAAIFPSGC